MNNGKMIGLLGGLALVFLIVASISAITDADHHKGEKYVFEYTDSIEMDDQIIDVGFSSENIDIYQSKTGKLEVYFIKTCGSENEYKQYEDKFEVKVTDSKILISADDIKQDYWIFDNFLSRLIAGNFNYESRLELGIPEGYENNLVVTVSSGNIKIQEIALDSMNVKASSGNIVISDITANNVDVATSSGNIELISIETEQTFEANASSGRITLDDIICDDLILQATSGNISGDHIVANSTNADTSSGRLNMNGDLGEGDFGASSGNVEVVYTKAEDNIDAHASSGRVSVSVPRDSEFQLYADFSSGNFSTDFDLDHVNSDSHNYDGATRNGADGFVINISVSSGNSSLNETR